MPSFKIVKIQCPICLKDRNIPYRQHWAIKKGMTSTKCFLCSRLKKGMTNKGSIRKGHLLIPHVSGDKHPFWIKDRRNLKIKVSRNYAENYQWKKSILTRDSYKCKISDNDCKGRLEVHHILRWEDFPKLRYQLNNGITLCHAHHPRKRAEEKRLSPYFRSLVSESKD